MASITSQSGVRVRRTPSVPMAKGAGLMEVPSEPEAPSSMLRMILDNSF